MRNEQEMFELILNIAKNDERIRAVYMNGSRTNPNVEKDKYQDYDIVYVVTETKTFLDNREWIAIFGEIAIVQEPDSNDFGWGIQADFDRSYAWLMLFKDGNRIDLHIQIVAAMREAYTKDSLTIPLLDKDNCLPEIPAANDSSYIIKKPTEAQFKGCCNEFWWCLNNVAKGIVRDQLPYAMRMYNVIVRDMLVKVLEWYIGMTHDFSVSVGMDGKYFKKHLSAEIYEAYAKTYSSSAYNELWQSIDEACSLFRGTALIIAGELGFEYNENDDSNMMAYLKEMRGQKKAD